jgi:outer membrane protein insertion porin family
LGEEEKIGKVLIKGNRRIESAAILKVVTQKAGELLDIDKVDADIRAIYALGHFRDVKAATGKGDNGVILTFTVKEKPIVREINIEGNKEIKEEKIREAIELKTGSIFSSRELAKSTKKVKKLYADEGYYLADVATTTIKKSDTGSVVFKISGSSPYQDDPFRRKSGIHGQEAQKGNGKGEISSWLTGSGHTRKVLKMTILCDLLISGM